MQSLSNMRNPVRGPWKTDADSERRRPDGTKRELVVTVEPLCIVYRVAGTRQEFRLPHAKAYLLAVQAHVDAQPRKRRRSIKRSTV